MKRVVIYFLLSMMMGAAMAQFPGGGFGPGGGRPMGDRPNMQQTTQKTYKGKTYSITGTLIDKTTKETLFYVNVALLQAEDSLFVKGVSSDDSGVFVLQGVVPGKYLLRASAIGYQTLYEPIDIDSSSVDMGKLYLQQGAAMLNGVEVTATRPIYSMEDEKIMYNVSEDPSIQTGTTSDALQNTPGVEVDVEGNVTLRGVSSVDIWINDKPSRLTAESLKNYIQQLPANTLERIEVITNPSAKYATKTDGGIINIVTNAKIKKNVFYSFGLNGSSQPRISPHASFVWANEKWSISSWISGSYSSNKNHNSGYSTSFVANDTTDQLDTSTFQRYTSEGRNKNWSGNISLNMHYSPDSLNSLSFWMMSMLSGGKSSSLEQRLRREYFLNEDNFYTTDRNSGDKGVWIGFGTWYTHLFNNQGHNIMMSLNGNVTNNAFSSDYVRKYILGTDLSKDKSTRGSSKSYDLNVDVDYSIPYSKNGEISVGLSGAVNWGSSLSSPDTLVFGTDIRNTDSLRFYDALFRTQDYATYVTLRQKFGNFTMKFGLRGEVSHIFYQVAGHPESKVSTTFFNLKPSVHLSYRTKSMHNFNLSYTRRLRNPSNTQLSEYIDYGEDDYSIGNSLLASVATNSFEFNWMKYFEKFGSLGITVYHRNSHRDINTLTDVAYSDVFGRYVRYTMPVNVGKSYNTGGEFNVTYRPKGFLNLRFYANIYDSYINYSDSKDANKNSVRHKFTYSFRINLWTKVWNVLEIHASANYRSASQSLFAETKPNYSINAGLRATFWKKRISVYLNVQDIFNWNKSSNITTSPYYESWSSNKTNSRYISAGVTFRFGKLEMEKNVQGVGSEE